MSLPIDRDSTVPPSRTSILPSPTDIEHDIDLLSQWSVGTSDLYNVRVETLKAIVWFGQICFSCYENSMSQWD